MAPALSALQIQICPCPPRRRSRLRYPWTAQGVTATAVPKSPDSPPVDRVAGVPEQPSELSFVNGAWNKTIKETQGKQGDKLNQGSNETLHQLSVIVLILSMKQGESQHRSLSGRLQNIDLPENCYRWIRVNEGFWWQGGDEDRKPCLDCKTLHSAQGPARVHFDKNDQSTPFSDLPEPSSSSWLNWALICCARCTSKWRITCPTVSQQIRNHPFLCLRLLDTLTTHSWSSTCMQNASCAIK